MLIEDLYSHAALLLRWFHIFSAILWLGHLFAAELGGAPVTARFRWWLRAGAMSTVFWGFGLFFLKYSQPGMLIDDEKVINARALWLLIGISLALVMWLLTWFVAERWEKALKVSAYLAGPQLFCMLAPNNYPYFGALPLLAVTAIGLGTVAALLRLASRLQS
jgi:hypothetical protein